MAFGDIPGIKKTGTAPPVEEEGERRPLRDTPLELSGLLGPVEREARRGASPAIQRQRGLITPGLEAQRRGEPRLAVPAPTAQEKVFGFLGDVASDVGEFAGRGVRATGVDTGITAEAAAPALQEITESPPVRLIEGVDRFVIRPAGAVLSTVEQQIIEEISSRLQGQVPENKVGQAIIAFRETEGTFDERIDAYTDALDLLPGQQGLNEVIAASFLDPIAPGQPFIPLARGAVGATQGVGRGFGNAARNIRRGLGPAEDLTELGGRFAAAKNPTVQKVNSLYGNLTIQREALESRRSVELGKKAAEIQKFRQSDLPPREALRRGRAARGGELSKGQVDSLLADISDDELDELIRIVKESPDLTDFEAARVSELVDPLANAGKSILDGYLPTIGEIGLLQRAFGDDLAETILKKVAPRTKTQILGDLALEIANTPRSLFSSFDISAPGRQGAIFAAAHPNISKSAFGAQMQALRSEKTAQVINRDILRHPDAALLDDAGVFIADLNPVIRAAGDQGGSALRAASRLSGREEAFLSNIFQRLSTGPLSKNPLLAPITAAKVVGKGVRASERAYVTYLNKVRADVFYQTIDEWRRAGRIVSNADVLRVTPELRARFQNIGLRGNALREAVDFEIKQMRVPKTEFRSLARFINNATGRGNLGPLEGARGVLSAAFFSPGLQASRLAFAASLFDPRTPVAVRRQLYKDAAKSFALGSSILGIAKAGGADVELDPRSTDFGRVKIGDTRLDFWGGFQPYARFAAQVATGERKNQAGEIINIREEDDQTVLEQTARIGRTKLSPFAGGIVDAITGSTIIGDEVISGTNAANTFVPGAIQDLGDAVLTEGKTGWLLGLPAALGIGVNSYDTTQSLRDAASERMPVSQDEVDLAPELNLTEGQMGVPYNQRPPYLQDVIDEDPEIAERFKEFEERETKISTRDLQHVVFTQQEEFETKANDQLMAQVRSGLQGASLREAVQNFNRERSAANRAVFDPFNERISKQPTLLRDQLALEYWTAPLELGPDGELDFDQRDKIRAEVLERRKDPVTGKVKVAASYISGTGPNTWRGTLNDVPELNTLLNSYHNDMDTLRAYWDVGNEPDFAGAFNRDEWQRYLEGGQAERRTIAQGSPAVRRAVQKQSAERLALRGNNEDIDKALVRWYEYLGQTVPGRGLYNRLYVEAA